METKPHNKYCRLVGKCYQPELYPNWKTKAGKIELVYGIENDGTNEGLEIYYYRKISDGHFYKSLRFNSNAIPRIYFGEYEKLKDISKTTPDGHKTDVNDFYLIG